MKRPSRVRQARARGYFYGIVAGPAMVLSLMLPGSARWNSPGPPNAGHEDLECQACHVPASGSFRQQVQANVRYVLGQRSTAADFGFKDVDNAACLQCHQRLEDVHPVFRFLEPRFQKVRETLQPHRCEACHQEHTGRRVTVEPTYCASCHRTLKVEGDSLDVSHEQLVAREAWQTCLGCHDFHGNHRHNPPRVLAEAVPVEQIRTYFEGGASPYPMPKIHIAKRSVPQ